MLSLNSMNTFKFLFILRTKSSLTVLLKENYPDTLTRLTGHVTTGTNVLLRLLAAAKTSAPTPYPHCPGSTAVRANGAENFNTPQRNFQGFSCLDIFYAKRVEAEICFFHRLKTANNPWMTLLHQSWVKNTCQCWPFLASGKAVD